MKGSLCRLAETSFLWRDTAMRIRERFNPRAPCGARRRTYGPFQCVRYFNPRAPCGARHTINHNIQTFHQNFNPRAPCGARLCFCHSFSIPRNFNPRAPCGARRKQRGNNGGSSLFQPTRPLRGATPEEEPEVLPKENFNPRAPCGARPIPIRRCRKSLLFQPTRPLRGATCRWV